MPDAPRHTRSRRERLSNWLEENVKKYPEPECVTLSDFQVDWNTFSGDFRVSFDSVALDEKLKFSPGASGKAEFCLPMYTSPFGVPWSYAAMEISDKTCEAISRGLWETIPRLRGAGLHPKTGREITYHTAPFDRIDPVEIERSRNRVTEDYSITIWLADFDWPPARVSRTAKYRGD